MRNPTVRESAWLASVDNVSIPMGRNIRTGKISYTEAHTPKYWMQSWDSNHKAWGGTYSDNLSEVENQIIEHQQSIVDTNKKGVTHVVFERQLDGLFKVVQVHNIVVQNNNRQIKRII